MSVEFSSYMCSIIGVFNNKDAVKLVCRGLGKGSWLYTDKLYKNTDKIPAAEHCIGGYDKPISGKGFLAGNSAIYNWKELAQKYKINAQNESVLLIKLIEKIGKVCDTAPLLDGDYAFSYWNEDLVLARDLIGVKPLFYSHSEGFAYGSEKKVLEALGYIDIQELNPRRFLTYNIKEDRVYFTAREFYKTTPLNTGRIEKIERLLVTAIKKRIPDAKIGLLFSGGIDSSVIALVLKKLGIDFTCYTTSFYEPTMKIAEDEQYATKVAEKLELKYKVIRVGLKDMPALLKKTVPIIEDTNVTKVGVALSFFPACVQAKKDKVRIMFSGLGSEEIFAGYERHKQSTNINQECVSGLKKMFERDTYRDDTITMANNLELRVPFLDVDLINYALKIPAHKKLYKGIEKHILREVAIRLGMPVEFAWRKKRAAQYGSKMNRALKKLAKLDNEKYISSYLRQFYPKKNLRLCSLLSGGKDSLYAMYVMHKQNYEINCLLTIKSENPDSYMFHTPAIDITSLQAKSLNLPHIVVKTRGEKEKELVDLKKGIKKARDMYQIDGIVTGALYSTYQRNRIEKICEDLGLKVFSPLWHVNQETVMHEIINSDFKFIFASVAADGLDKTWLGRQIDRKDVTKLARVNRKIGLNIAGEGGEFESLVLDMPLFSGKIEVDYKIDMENANTGRLIIGNARLLKDKI